MYGKIITYADDTCSLFSIIHRIHGAYKSYFGNVSFNTETQFKKKISINYNKTFFMMFSIYNFFKFQFPRKSL